MLNAEEIKFKNKISFKYQYILNTNPVQFLSGYIYQNKTKLHYCKKYIKSHFKLNLHQTQRIIYNNINNNITLNIKGKNKYHNCTL